jgi:hypothetical protein
MTDTTDKLAEALKNLREFSPLLTIWQEHTIDEALAAYAQAKAQPEEPGEFDELVKALTWFADKRHKGGQTLEAIPGHVLNSKVKEFYLWNFLYLAINAITTLQARVRDALTEIETIVKREQETVQTAFVLQARVQEAVIILAGSDIASLPKDMPLSDIATARMKDLREAEARAKAENLARIDSAVKVNALNVEIANIATVRALEDVINIIMACPDHYGKFRIADAIRTLQKRRVK